MEGHHEGEPGTRSSPLVIGGSPSAGSVTGPPASRHLVPPSRSSGRSGPATVSDYRQRGSLGGGSGGLGAAGAGGILSDQAREAVQRASIVAAASQYVTNGGTGRGGGAQAQEVYDTMMGGRRGSGADAGAGGSGYHLSDALLSREVARERAAAAAAASAAATVAMQEKKQRADAVAAVVAQQLYRGPTEEEQLAQLRQQQEGAQERSVALLLKQAEGRIARKRSESAAAVAAAAAAATGGSAGLYGMKRSRLLDAGGGAGYSQIGASRYYPSPSSSVAGASPSLRPQQRQQAPSPHLSGIEAAVGGSKSEDILKHQRLVNQVLSTAAARKAAGNRPSSSTASTSSSPTHKPMEKPSPSVSSHASAPPEGLDIQDLGRGAQGSSKATPASSTTSAQRQRQQYIDRFNPTPGAKDAASLEVEIVQEGQQQQLRSSPQLKPDKLGGEGGRGIDRGGGSNEGEARTREDIIADVNRMIKQARSGKATQPASSTSHATTTEMLRAKAADAAAAAAATLNQQAVAAAAAAVSLSPGGGAKTNPGGSPGTGDGTPISWRGRGPVSVELTHSQRAALERTSFFRDDASLIRELSLWEGGMPREGVVKALRRSLLMTCLPQANIPEAEASEIVKCFL